MCKRVDTPFGVVEFEGEYAYLLVGDMQVWLVSYTCKHTGMRYVAYSTNEDADETRIYEDGSTS